METYLINIKQTFETIGKWMVSTILICATFGLLYQIASIYQYKQYKDNYKHKIDANNIFFALKKGWFITVLNIVLFFIIYVNIKYMYILSYNKIFTYILLLSNFILIFEWLLINIYYPLFAANGETVLAAIKKSFYILNLNIGLSLLALFGGLIVLSCIIASPFTAYFLVPVSVMVLEKIYEKLETKYIVER